MRSLLGVMPSSTSSISEGGDDGVSSTVVLTAWGPTSQNAREVLMITVVTGPNRTAAEVDQMLSFLRELQNLQRVANDLPPLPPDERPDDMG